ncbi:MAG: hypothetical protein NTZ02_02465 [Candidatus Woesearchaeota archaeon]|nr:hypothetical protein [Candidatus Woesearchaeota archaeon]
MIIIRLSRQREPEEKAEEKEDKKEEKKEKREEKKRKAGLFAKKHEEEKEEDEVRIDWKKAAKMFDARWLWVLLILIPIILTSTIRIQPNTLAITQDWATGTVYNVYKNSIAQQVSSMYPNLPDANKQTLVDQQFKAYLNSNSAAIDNQIKQTAAYFKSKMQYDVNGASYTYLGDLDSYYFLRYAEN